MARGNPLEEMVTDAVRTWAGRFICAAILLVALIGPAASRAQSDTAPKAKPEAPSLTKEEVTELSGLTVVEKKPAPTPLSGVTVAARRSTRVSELEVTAPKCPPAQASTDAADQPPKLLSTYPAGGSTVRGGIVILRLTFDRPMTCAGLLANRPAYPNPCPAPLADPLFSRDRRTFLTVCILDVKQRQALGPEDSGAASKTYGLKLRNFTSLSGQPLEPRDLEFNVSSLLLPVTTVKEAMAQDKFLRDAQKAAEQAP